MSNLILPFFVCACSSDGDFETQSLDYEIDHESLSIMISEEVIQYGDQYNIYFAQDFASNPIMELELFNHKSMDSIEWWQHRPAHCRPSERSGGCGGGSSAASRALYWGCWW